MPQPSPDRGPNVVLVITDDQGYGDLACHGNPVISTPNIDELGGVSFRLDNFHVGPTCSPTRAGLMTGRYCNATGVWHTLGGREFLRADEVTVADHFRAAGYVTGHFGKWHLGDNYPFRPQDRGFDEVITHGDGAIGTTPDHWGNDYFDDTYIHNGVKEEYEGYCTDVWFREATRFIEQNRDPPAGGRPFFCYIPTNAPHGPYHVPARYAAPYRGKVPDRRANFYGMITCIDENVGRLRRRLEELGLAEDTIFIFMTDNGSSGGCDLDEDGFVVGGYNAGMRGRKGSEYDGGHRVPVFLHWPGGGLVGPKVIERLTANIDMLPTLTELCGIPGPEPGRIHGRSLVPLLRGEEESWPERVIATDSQRIERPRKWKQSSTMCERWRLVNGTELYDIKADPGQRRDVAHEHPDVVEELRAHYEAWWAIVSGRFDEDSPVVIGTEHERETMLTGEDWHNEQCLCPWHQGHIRQGLEANGYHAIDVAEAGEYEFELRRWPREEETPMTGGMQAEKVTWYEGGRALGITSARIRVGDEEATLAVDAETRGVTFSFRLEAGLTTVQTWLTDAEGKSVGAYYVYVRKPG